MSLIFFDFETTGLNIHSKVKPDKIIQFMFLNASSQEYYSSFVNPNKNIPPKVVSLTGLTNDDVSTYKTIDHYIPLIVDFIGTTEPVFLIGHNCDSFDKIILLNEVKNCNLTVPSNWHFIDTLKLARNLLPDLENHKLDTLRAHFSLSTVNSHLASKDVLDLEKIYKEIAKNKTPWELLDLSKKFSQIMPFGKHKGEHFRNIPANYFTILLHSGYISETQNTDLYHNLRAFYGPKIK
jgi:DNA polymerase III epsilon subunit-like protein